MFWKNVKGVTGRRDKKSHLFGGWRRDFLDAEDMLEGKFVDSLAVVEHNAVKIAFLISIADIGRDNGLGLCVKVNLHFHGILLV